MRTTTANASLGPRDHTPPSRGQVVAVLLGSGAIGFVLGMGWNPMWQDALEPAQVLAGLVTYPPQNPVYLYSINTWTVLHQAIALLLQAGFSERALALLLNGVVGMVSFQALGVFVLALSRDVPLAILCPFFIFFTNAASGGVTYPVALMGAQATYGVIGLSYMLLTIALIGAGRAQWGALLLGFGPAVHLTIGAWCVAIVTLAVGLGPRSARHSVKRAWPYFLAGVAAAVLSAIVHYLHANPPPPARYLSGFLQHWDHHRQPFPLLSGQALAVYFSASLPALWLWRFRDDVPDYARVLLRALIAAAVVGGVLSASYWLIPATVPNVIPSLMPSRVLNLNVVTCMALIVGLSARYRCSLWIQSNLAVLVLVLMALTVWMGQEDVGTGRALFAWVGMGLSGLTLAVLAELRRRGIERSPPRPMQIDWLRRAQAGALAAALAGMIVVMVSGRFTQTVREELSDRTTDPLFAAASERPGLLLTAHDLHLIQARTRRPVLLDGYSLDSLVYVPDAAHETDRILRRVYGTDLPTIQRAHAGGLIDEAGNKRLWEARSPEEWQQIAREFGVTDVLTGAGWRLHLSVIASSAEFMLYGIPLVNSEHGIVAVEPRQLD